MDKIEKDKIQMSKIKFDKIPEKLLNSNGKIYYHPVLNGNTGRIAEKIFCEGVYDEVANFKQECDRFSSSPYYSGEYYFNWEKDFIKCVKQGNFEKSKFDNIVFTKENLHKLERFFEVQVDDDEYMEYEDKYAEFLIDKILENVKQYDEENSNFPKNETSYFYDDDSSCNGRHSETDYSEEEVIFASSKHYLMLGSFLINMFTKNNNDKKFKIFLKKGEHFDECYEAWENFFLNSGLDKIKLLLKFNKSIFFVVFNNIIKRIYYKLINTEFYSYLFEISKIVNANRMYNIMFQTCKNKLDRFSTLFDSFIINADKLEDDDKFFDYAYRMAFAGKTSFYQHGEFLNYFMKYDTKSRLITQAFNKIITEKNYLQHKSLLQKIFEAIEYNEANKSNLKIKEDDKSFNLLNEFKRFGYNPQLINIKGLTIGEHMPNCQSLSSDFDGDQ